MAQIVTVPLELPRPVMLRSPLAAADHGPVAEAIPLHEQTLAACERVLGPDHTYTLSSRNNLAEGQRVATGCRSCRIGRAAVSASSMAWLRSTASWRFASAVPKA
jgi:hypothetical protein